MIMRLSRLALILALPTLLFCSCIVAIGDGASDGFHSSWHWNGKRGSGVSATQSRAVPEFSRVRLDGSCFVEVDVGGSQSLSITADDNLIDDLLTEVRGGELVITTRDGVNAAYRVGPSVRIEVPSLSAFSIHGSGDARLRGLAGESFAVSIHGSGDLSASGRVTKLHVSIEGSGDADLMGLECQEASVAIQGSGDVGVNCTSSLTAAVSGSGDVDYRGAPPHTSISVSGSGDVTPVKP